MTACPTMPAATGEPFPRCTPWNWSFRQRRWMERFGRKRWCHAPRADGRSSLDTENASIARWLVAMRIYDALEKCFETSSRSPGKRSWNTLLLKNAAVLATLKQLSSWRERNGRSGLDDASPRHPNEAIWRAIMVFLELLLENFGP